MYWFRRNPFSRQVSACFADSDLENMGAFLAMSRHSELQKIVETLREHGGGSFIFHPGEYLELSVEGGRVTARICLCDAFPCRMDVDFFCRLVTDYLAAWESLRRELGEE